MWAKWWFECRVSKVDVFENVFENSVVKIDKDHFAILYLTHGN